MATAGEKPEFGSVKIASDATGLDVAEWAVETARVEIHWIIASVAEVLAGATIGEATFSVKDTAGNPIVQSFYLTSNSGPLVVVFPPGSRPAMRGLIIDTPGGTPTGPVSYSVGYSLAK